MSTTDAPWVPDLGTFGARLAVVRQHMGWNMKEAARECGVPQNSWTGWELFGREPRGLARVSRSIAERTGVDYVWLMTGQAPAGQGAIMVP